MFTSRNISRAKTKLIRFFSICIALYLLNSVYAGYNYRFFEIYKEKENSSVRERERERVQHLKYNSAICVYKINFEKFIFNNLTKSFSKIKHESSLQQILHKLNILKICKIK